MSVRILIGDALEKLRTLPDASAQCCVTSPPYHGLRDYGVDGQIGLEETPDEYVAKLVEVFREVRRVLKDDGTLWLNLGDSYAGSWGNQGRKEERGTQRPINGGMITPVNDGRHKDKSSNTGKIPKGSGLKPKDLMMIPETVAIALRADGWWLRDKIVWHKCLAGSTTVYARTQKGEAPCNIKDLVRLDPETVQLWDGKKWNQCLGFFEKKASRPCQKDMARRRYKQSKTEESQPLIGDIEIELRSGEKIGCTREHKWPTLRGIVESKDLVVGDILETCLLPEPRNITPDHLPDEDIGWLVGTYLADGSMSKNDSLLQISSNSNESVRFSKLKEISKKFDCDVRVHFHQENSASVHIHSKILCAIIRTYISGCDCYTKTLARKSWSRSNSFLQSLLIGWLDGDAWYDEKNDRYKIGFCQNSNLAQDLRTLSGRLGFKLRLKRRTHTSQWGDFKGWRGEIRLSVKTHHNEKKSSEIVALRHSKAGKFFDIVLEEDPHLFALASGVLTHNSNPMPSSVKDRCTPAWESVFMLAKSKRYFFDADAIAEEATGRPSGNGFERDHRISIGGRGQSNEWEGSDKRNARNVWTISSEPCPEAHFAVMPTELAKRCVLAGSRPGDTILDPFGGAGTTGLVADRLQRDAVLIELNPEYVEIAKRRIHSEAPLLVDVA